MKKKFEEMLSIIETEIKKRRSKWFLSSITYLDFDDVTQILKAHINKKWHLWDQEKALEPWLNRVISNQLKNLIRNNYGIFAKPCINCPFNEGNNINLNACSFTSDGLQSEECPLYKKWAKNKKNEYNIKIPTSFEVHDFEISCNKHESYDLENAAERLHYFMKKRLNSKQFLAYKLLFIEKIEEEEAAKKLGYKTSEKNRTAGYRQIKNLKNYFNSVAKKIIQEEDIFYV